ncbi:MAG: hypothetical protein QM820_18705 [Minicystis sp.]
MFDGSPMEVLLQRAVRQEIVLVPILLRRVVRESTRLGILRWLPADGMPVSERDPDEAFTAIVAEIRAAIESRKGRA